MTFAWSFTVFMVADVIAYCIAPWPWRDRWYYKALPGGGFAAFLIGWLSHNGQP